MKKENKSEKRSNIAAYILIGVLGVVLLFLSFVLDEKLNSVLTGIGTGLLTSLSVSVLIELRHKHIMKAKNANDKKLFLNDIAYYAEDNYLDIMYRINEFIIDYYKKNDFISKAYENETECLAFFKKVEAINIDTLTKEEKEFINRLFYFHNYKIDGLVEDLRKLPKEQLYLTGILNKEEYMTISSSHYNSMYEKYVEYLPKFWDYDVIDLKSCVKFTKIILLICEKVIKNSDFRRKDIEKKEEDMLLSMNQKYFYDIHSKTDEFLINGLEQQNDLMDYYENHPEEYEEWQKGIDENDVLKTIICAAWCNSPDMIKDLLKREIKWDKESFEYLCVDKNGKKLMKDKTIKELFKNKFNVVYKRKIKWKEEFSNI